MREKPALGFWQVWNMSFGFLGIQFGFALQNANVSRIFQSLGASIDDLPLLWLAAPVTGLLVQPVIGYLSDRTWGRLGRRRPYFLAGAIAATLALVVMPNSPALWIAAGTLWILDASINVSMEPFRALVGDMLPDRQRASGFAIQSLFIGAGAVIASALPWLLANAGVANTAEPGGIPDTVRWAFYLGAAAFLGAVLWTVVSTKEYSPDELALFHGGDDSLHREQHDARDGRTRPTGMLREIAADVVRMPAAMRQLAVVQFLSWFALFAMWIYTTAAVTGRHFGATDTTSAAWNEGANWVGVLFAAYNGFAALAAPLIPLLAARIGRKRAHLLNLALGGAGLVSFAFIDDPHWLLASMVGVGIAWASILSLPYAMLSGAVPAAKMGVYMGIFNFFIVIPQILAAAVLGWMVRAWFGGESVLALVAGGVLMVLAGLASLRVDDRGDART
jgi:maltose/moltooligosaccharide transporter